MVDAVVSVLLDKLLNSLQSEVLQLLQLDDQFNKMRDELHFMKSFVNEADRVRKRDGRDILKMVTGNLRELVYDAEHVLEDCEVLFQKQQNGCLSNITNCCSPQLLIFRYQITKRLKVINKGIEEVKKKMPTYLAAAPSTITSREDGTNAQLRYPILITEDNMVGLEDDSTKVTGWILKADQSFMAIGIVGMGGIGKTTLAQKICNNDSVKRTFDHIIFDTVSQHCEFEALLKKMLRRLNVEEESLTGKEVIELLQRLKSELEDKKYLVVLDDVWVINEGNWWGSLNSALPKENGSCVIVTTRKLEVARSMGATNKHIHYPQCLSDDDSWSLFAKVAFARHGGRCSNPELECFGKEIVRSCGGLPLAIKVVGGMMLGKGDFVLEWKRISENLRDELEEKNDGEPIMSSLELSYEELPAYLKPCLLCTSLYPEDHPLDIDELVDVCIGEGFVSGRKGRTASDIGRECFQELINRCLLIEADRDAFERRFDYCRVHDLVRDMARKIARDENFISLDASGKPLFNFQSHRIGIYEKMTIERIRGKEVNNSSLNSKLRTLIGMRKDEDAILSIKEVKLSELRWLKVLQLRLRDDASKIIGIDWFDGIGSLRHLVYLSIHHWASENLLDSIGNLHNLQILDLCFCPMLRSIPPTIKNLDKLIKLNVFYCGGLDYLPDEIGRLSMLEQLTGFIPASSSHKNAFRFSQLKNFRHLRSLEVKINSPDQLEDGDLNVLKELQHLQLLAIDFDIDYGDDDERISFVSKLNHELLPLQCLEELYLVNFPGESTPVWLNSTSFPNLRLLGIDRADQLTHMGPEFCEREHGDWKIEGLLLQLLPKLEEEWERLHGAMPSLRMARVSYCPKFKSFPSYPGGIWRIWRKEEVEGDNIGTSTGR